MMDYKSSIYGRVGGASDLVGLSPANAPGPVDDEEWKRLFNFERYAAENTPSASAERNEQPANTEHRSPVEPKVAQSNSEQDCSRASQDQALNGQDTGAQMEAEPAVKRARVETQSPAENLPRCSPNHRAEPRVGDQIAPMTWQQGQQRAPQCSPRLPKCSQSSAELVQAMASMRAPNQAPNAEKPLRFTTCSGVGVSLPTGPAHVPAITRLAPVPGTESSGELVNARMPLQLLRAGIEQQSARKEALRRDLRTKPYFCPCQNRQAPAEASGSQELTSKHQQSPAPVVTFQTPGTARPYDLPWVLVAEGTTPQPGAVLRREPQH
ncbi:hypothetical protein CkaCkLH20_11675 [Colletotrichum karsti]|uniref:Uncharacterized protein n=1 Tax=Colletotrichum karsti TaxID=1095194 RepID=A0A9P6HXD7_9PEZI|nr:uncharacterized protein CkaCkLH20_11675 [Colletotrichum karsti]KAF9870776.1 hypothetical protein CkaCkLH20_11675 [Colletotrichum karsti]